MKTIAFTVLALLLVAGRLQAQGLGIGTTSPDPSARLDVSSSTQGILLPRMTAAQRNAIASPAAGLMVYQTDGVPGYCFFNGGSWINLSTGVAAGAQGYSANYGLTVTVAGTGVAGNVDGTVSTASFNYPCGIAVDADNNLYTADLLGARIRRIGYGWVATIAGGVGSSAAQNDGNGGSFAVPQSVVVDQGGSVLYVADAAKLRMITGNGRVATVATTSSQLLALAMDAAGNLVASDVSHILKYSGGGFTVLAGSGAQGSADGMGPAASFFDPTGLAIDRNGNIYVADQLNNLIRKITPAGMVTTLAGSGSMGFRDGVGTAASFNHPTGVAVDAYGNVYVTDQNNNRIRKITPDGVVSTFAGNGTAGRSDGMGTAASFNLPCGITIDGKGYLYVTEVGNQLIRRITAF
jgi:sugar lactone lactonase YvrE